MKNHYKHILAALAIATVASGSFLIAQTAPAVTPPGPAGSARGERGMGMGRRGGRQPHMEAALRYLQIARTQLDAALPDKGGNRERAIASIDQAIKDVQAGIDYAAAHPEEFPGMRGRREGGPGEPGGTGAPTTSNAPPAISAPTISVPSVGG
jgi:hypothetical protein